MIKQSFDIQTEHPASPCCECGHVMDRCDGPDRPSPGDFSLCIRCACLNVFGEDLRLRPPTDDEIFEAAASPAVQQVRRLILAVHAKAKEQTA